MRKLILLFAALLLGTLAMAPSASAASPYGTYPNCAGAGRPVSSQAWDITKGLVGGGEKHIHTEVCFPMYATVSSPVTIDVRSQYHNIVGEKARHINMQDGRSQVALQGIDPALTIPTNSYIRVDSFVLDPAKFSVSGWQQIRIHTMVDGPKGRWYTSTYWPVFINNGKARSDYGWTGSSSDAGFCGGSGWYGQYMYARVHCGQLRTALAGTHVSPILERLELDRGIVSMNPDFHNGNVGTVVFNQPGSSTYRSVPVTAGVVHSRTEVTRTTAPLGHFAGAFIYTMP